MTPTPPIVGITAGDPAGIGYEIVLRLLADPAIYDICSPVVYGSLPSLRRDAEWLDHNVEFDAGGVAQATSASPGRVVVHDVAEGEAPVPLGAVAAAAGEIAVRSIKAAVSDALGSRIAAICTAPLHKESMWEAGYRYDGHTGLLSELCGGAAVSMLLIGDRLRVAHVTTHQSLASVPERITPERVKEVIEIAGATLKRLGFTIPRIAVAGLNPHAGEHGIFGDEEMNRIVPALEEAREAGWHVRGPISPDAVFNDALAGHYDVVIAMYHDQGHIPVKLIEFDRAVNVSGGLPIIRTSVDHGTAFDIAGRGIARTENLDVALRLASQLSSDCTARSATT